METKILYIDKDSLNRELVSKLLGRAYKNIVSIPLPKSDTADIDGFDILIVDMSPPWKKELSIILNVQKSKKQLPIISLSSEPQMILELKRTEHTIDSFLGYPFNFKKTVEEIERLTAKRLGLAPLNESIFAT